jgi:hypothetical protein
MFALIVKRKASVLYIAMYGQTVRAEVRSPFAGRVWAIAEAERGGWERLLPRALARVFVLRGAENPLKRVPAFPDDPVVGMLQGRRTGFPRKPRRPVLFEIPVAFVVLQRHPRAKGRLPVLPGETAAHAVSFLVENALGVLPEKCQCQSCMGKQSSGIWERQHVPRPSRLRPPTFQHRAYWTPCASPCARPLSARPPQRNPRPPPCFVRLARVKPPRPTTSPPSLYPPRCRTRPRAPQ